MHMKYKSNCPKCHKQQSRWEMLEPFPGFINQCEDCGTDYKSGKLSYLIGGLFGLALVACFIMADKDFLQWPVAIITISALLLAAIILTPYYTKLIEAPEQPTNILQKWMLPFVRWQVFLITFVIIIIIGNSYISILNEEKRLSYYALQEKTKSMESPEKLKVLAEHNYTLLFLELEFQNILIKFNIRISCMLLLLFTLNFVFYFKVKYSHNKSLNLTVARNAPPS